MQVLVSCKLPWEHHHVNISITCLATNADAEVPKITPCRTCVCAETQAGTTLSCKPLGAYCARYLLATDGIALPGILLWSAHLPPSLSLETFVFLWLSIMQRARTHVTLCAATRATHSLQLHYTMHNYENLTIKHLRSCVATPAKLLHCDAPATWYAPLHNVHHALRFRAAAAGQ
jgi:hypothetical protein